MVYKKNFPFIDVNWFDMQVRELEAKMDTISIEVKDFEGAVKMQAALVEKLVNTRKSEAGGEKGKEKKMTETQRALLEAKIVQCQQATLDLAAKLAGEKRDRDADFDQVLFSTHNNNVVGMSGRSVSSLINMQIE